MLALDEQVIDNFQKFECFGRTLNDLLGIDPATIVPALGNRPTKVIAEDSTPIIEALAYRPIASRFPLSSRRSSPRTAGPAGRSALG